MLTYIITPLPMSASADLGSLKMFIKPLMIPWDDSNICSAACGMRILTVSTIDYKKIREEMIKLYIVFTSIRQLVRKKCLCYTSYSLLSDNLYERNVHVIHRIHFYQTTCTKEMFMLYIVFTSIRQLVRKKCSSYTLYSLNSIRQLVRKKCSSYTSYIKLQMHVCDYFR